MERHSCGRTSPLGVDQRRSMLIDDRLSISRSVKVHQLFRNHNWFEWAVAFGTAESEFSHLNGRYEYILIYSKNIK